MNGKQYGTSVMESLDLNKIIQELTKNAVPNDAQCGCRNGMVHIGLYCGRCSGTNRMPIPFEEIL